MHRPRGDCPGALALSSDEQGLGPEPPHQGPEGMGPHPSQAPAPAQASQDPRASGLSLVPVGDPAPTSPDVPPLGPAGREEKARCSAVGRLQTGLTTVAGSGALFSAWAPNVGPTHQTPAKWLWLVLQGRVGRVQGSSPRRAGAAALCLGPSWAFLNVA